MKLADTTSLIRSQRPKKKARRLFSCTRIEFFVTSVKPGHHWHFTPITPIKRSVSALLQDLEKSVLISDLTKSWPYRLRVFCSLPGFFPPDLTQFYFRQRQLAGRQRTRNPDEVRGHGSTGFRPTVREPFQTLNVKVKLTSLPLSQNLLTAIQQI